MKPGYIAVLIIYLLSLAIRTGYEVLKRKNKADSKSIPLFIFILLVMCLMWASWFALCPMDPLRIDLPSIVNLIGLGLLILGLILAVTALIQLRGVENIDHLVTSGLFARLRHPMYLGFILWIFGWAIFHGAAASLLAGLVGTGNILYWRHLEEEHLEKTFGVRYQEYRVKTWF